jgi:hypothetical protein
MKSPAAILDRNFLEKLERLALRWQRSFPGLVGGTNRSHFSGPGQEFLDHRHFQHGDDVRSVNWRAYLRLEKLFLKMFQVEPRVPVRLLLDLSESMTATGGARNSTMRAEAGGGAVLRRAGAARFDRGARFSNRFGASLLVQRRAPLGVRRCVMDGAAGRAAPPTFMAVAREFDAARTRSADWSLSFPIFWTSAAATGRSSIWPTSATS